MTEQQIELMCIAARNLLAHRDCGRKCDPEAVRWAETVLRNNVAFRPSVPRKPAFVAHETESEGGEL